MAGNLLIVSILLNCILSLTTILDLAGQTSLHQITFVIIATTFTTIFICVSFFVFRLVCGIYTALSTFVCPHTISSPWPYSNLLFFSSDSPSQPLTLYLLAYILVSFFLSTLHEFSYVCCYLESSSSVHSTLV